MRRLVIALLLSAMTAAATAQDEDNLVPSPDELTVEGALTALRNGEMAKGTAILQALGEQADPVALFHLAEMARLGIGRDEPSMPIATMYYRLSGNLGNEMAAMKLANILYFDGTGTEAEISEALSIWQTYAIEGNAEASYLLGILYWNGEHGRPADPVRGYGLVWRASQAGYRVAVQTELTMRSQLPGDARTAAKAYGQNLEQHGFSDELLAIELLVEDYVPEAGGDTSQGGERPEDWTKVWRLEVGFAMRDEDASALLTRIRSEHGSSVADLYGEVTPSPNRPGMYRLVFGPIDGMHDAVGRCVALKRAGHDCFAKPPTG